MIARLKRDGNRIRHDNRRIIDDAGIATFIASENRQPLK
jgi:hypothetical protein